MPRIFNSKSAIRNRQSAIRFLVYFEFSRVAFLRILFPISDVYPPDSGAPMLCLPCAPAGHVSVRFAVCDELPARPVYICLAELSGWDMRLAAAVYSGNYPGQILHHGIHVRAAASDRFFPEEPAGSHVLSSLSARQLHSPPDLARESRGSGGSPGARDSDSLGGDSLLAWQTAL